MKFKIITISVIALSVLSLAGVFGFQTLIANQEGNLPPIAETIAEQFDLDRNEVGETLKEARQEHIAELEKRYQERLDEAVADGEITEAQKETILAKKATIKEKSAELKGLHQDLRSWAEENDVDPRLISPGKHGKFPGHRGHRGQMK